MVVWSCNTELQNWQKCFLAYFYLKIRNFTLAKNSTNAVSLRKNSISQEELDYQCLGYKSLFTLIVQHKYCTTLVFGTVQALVNCKCVHEKNSIAYLTSPIAEYINYTNTKKKKKMNILILFTQICFRFAAVCFSTRGRILVFLFDQ